MSEAKPAVAPPNVVEEDDEFEEFAAEGQLIANLFTFNNPLLLWHRYPLFSIVNKTKTRLGTRGGRHRRRTAVARRLG
jgi:hypothetical protein